MSKKVIAIVGPTSVGKSSLGVLLAHHFNGEIINGDSISIYKELNIGSAKITEEEMEGIPHHLVDYKEATEDYNVAIFQKDARAAIEDILSRGKTPIIVGGTGLYIKAVLYDYSFVEMEAKHNDYDGVTTEELVEKLKQLDPKSAAEIHPNNRKRIIRALEMAESGTLKSEQEATQQHTMIYDSKIIGLTMDREKLKERIDYRVDLMINQGLVKEVSDLFAKYPLTSHSFQAIGYKEFIGMANGNQSLEETIEQIKLHTRQFAKRQYTWFNNQMKVDWYDILQEDYKNQILKDVEEFIND